VPLPPGIRRRHLASCPAAADPAARCRGRCPYQVQAGPRDARKTHTAYSLDAAIAWKRDHETATSQARRTRGRAPTLDEAMGRWLADARAGVALARGRRRFRPGTRDEYERLARAELLPGHGHRRIDELGDHLDALVVDLQRRGLATSTIRNVLMPLRAMYRHAVRVRWVAANPTVGLELPSVDERRVRTLPLERVDEYVAAVPAADRALWATAFYAGLRRGELQALTWTAVDLAGGVLHVLPETGSYDQRTRIVQGPKSTAGARRVPVVGALRDHLVAHRADAGARPRGLVFARGRLAGSCRAGTEDQPFNDSSTGGRAARAWLAAGLPPCSLHDARHTFASMAIAAMAARGVFNPKLLQEVMGHTSIQVTFDRYGHLFPGAQHELAGMLDDLHAAQALPPVAQAWSRLQAELDAADPHDARPTVAQALAGLRSWRDAHPDPGLLPSRTLDVQDPAHRAASVQRAARRQEP
jgi:integrase